MIDIHHLFSAWLVFALVYLISYKYVRRDVLYWVFLGGSACALVWAFFSVSAYFVFPNYYDQLEPLIASLGAYWRQGHALYTSLDSPYRYSSIYGPLPFVVNAVFQGLPLPVIEASKIPGVVNLIITVSCVAILARQLHVKRQEFLLFVGCFVAALLGFKNTAYWSRGDSYMLAGVSCVCLASELCQQNRRLIFYLVLGFFAGLCCAAKIFSGFLFLPLLVFFIERDSRNGSLAGLTLSVLVGIFAGLSLFTLPGISLPSHLEWLQVYGSHPLQLYLFSRNLTYMIPFFLLIWISGFGPRYRSTFFATFGVGIIICTFGSILGAGAYHCLPFLPVLFYFCLIGFKQCESIHLKLAEVVGAGLIFAIFYFCVAEQRSVGQFFLRYNEELAWRKDLENILDKYPGSMAMGYAANHKFDRTFFRPLVITARHRLLIEPMPMMDMIESKITMPSSTISAIQNCDVDYYVLPKSDQPWGLQSDFGPMTFNAQFVSAFQKAYVSLEQTAEYTVYGCAARR
jgi:hypothetical protein